MKYGLDCDIFVVDVIYKGNFFMNFVLLQYGAPNSRKIPKICFYQKIHNFYAINMKLGQNVATMGCLFTPSFVMIA